MSDLVMLADRCRLLTKEQRAYVIGVLDSAATRCMRNARAMREKAAHLPQPYAGFRGARAIEHAANAGACNIAGLLITALGESGGPVPPAMIPMVCPDCGSHGRLPCPCLPEQYDDVAELVGKVDCGNCGGDGDFLCPRCFGRGAILGVRGPHEAKGVRREQPDPTPDNDLSHRGGSL